MKYALLAQQVDLQQNFFLSNPDAAVYSDIGILFSFIVPNLIIFAGVFFLLLIIYAGYQLIILGGQFNPPDKVAKAKGMVTNGIIGFLLVISAYFILQIVSTITGVNFMNAPIT